MITGSVDSLFEIGKMLTFHLQGHMNLLTGRSYPDFENPNKRKVKLREYSASRLEDSFLITSQDPLNYRRTDCRDRTNPRNGDRRSNSQRVEIEDRQDR